MTAHRNDCRRTWLVFALVCALTFVFTGMDTMAFDVTYSQSLTNGVTLDGNDAGNNVVPTATTGGYKYDLTDKAGTGVPGTSTVTTPGISLGTNKLDNYIHGMGSAGYWGNVNDDDIEFDLAGGDLLGQSGTVSLDTHVDTIWGDHPSGSIILRNVRDVIVGKILTYTDVSHWGHGISPAGNVVIGSVTNRARNVRIDAMDTRSQTSGSAGSIQIHASGNVLIETEGGVPGNIDTRSGGVGDPGSFTVTHEGNFSIGNIIVYGTGGNYPDAGDLTFDGAAVSGTPVGTFTCNHIDGYTDHPSWAGSGSTVNIFDYTSVTITGHIYTYAKDEDQRGGNITIGDDPVTPETDEGIAGDITILGNIDCSAFDANPGPGQVFLKTTDGGTIMIGDVSRPGEGILDLDLVKYITFDSSTTKSTIYQSITNFVPGSPNTQFRVARDGDVVYYSVKNGANSHLSSTNNGTYPISSNEGGIGLLRVLGARGTVVVFK